MSKRMTDTQKWRKHLLRSLSAKYKLLWIFLTDECDHAGIWDVDMEAASFYIGEKIEHDEAIKLLGDKIRIFDDGKKWFIPSFIEFQYGVLNPANRVHVSVIARLQKYNLMSDSTPSFTDIKPLTSPLQGAKDKDKVQEKVQDKALEQDQEQEEAPAIPENTTTTETAKPTNPLSTKTFEGRMEVRKVCDPVYAKWNMFAKKHGLCLFSPTFSRDEQIMRRIGGGEIDLDRVMEKILESQYLLGKDPKRPFNLSMKYILELDHAREIVEGVHDTRTVDPVEAQAQQAIAEAERKLEERKRARDN